MALRCPFVHNFEHDNRWWLDHVFGFTVVWILLIDNAPFVGVQSGEEQCAVTFRLCRKSKCAKTSPLPRSIQ